jgi:hypothetical protein
MPFKVQFNRQGFHYTSLTFRHSIRKVINHLRQPRWLPVIPLVISLAACSSLGFNRVYVHDDAAQKAAETAQTAWKSVLPATVFDQQKTFLSKLAADEVATAKITIAAQRDLQLVQLLEEPDGSSIVQLLQDRFKDLAGASGSLASAAMDKKVADDRVTLSNDTFLLGVWSTRLKIDGFKGAIPTCDGAITPQADATDNQKADFTEFKTVCDTLNQHQKELNNDLSDPSAGKTGGKLSATLNTLTTLQTQLNEQQKQAAALQALLKSRQDAVNSAKKGSPEAQTAATELRFCLADSSSTSDQKAANPPNPASLSSDINTCAVNIAQQADPVLKQLKHTALRDDIQSVLTSMLNANAKNPSGTNAPPTSAATTAALRTLASLADVADAIENNQQPSVNALLVALAYEQYQVNVNADAVQALNQRIAILQERREAYVSEISFLARALQEIDKPLRPKVLPPKPPSYRDIGKIRSYVNSSWNIGAYRAELTDYAENDLTRANSARVSSTIVTAWQNVLQPAFDEFVAYGNGGLDAQTISNLIIAIVNAGGFAAVAKGVN